MNENTHSGKKSQGLLEQMGRIPVIVQGKVCERHSGGKVTGVKLQRWRDGRNETRHIPAELAETVREGTRGYERFMGLARQYVAAREAEALREGPGSKKKPTTP